MSDVFEEKILFKEGEEIRILRGVIEREDDFFIYVRRNPGLYRIGKQFIIKTEPDKKQNILGSTINSKRDGDKNE